MAPIFHEVGIEIGGMVIVVRTDSAEFANMLIDRYGTFVPGLRPKADASSKGTASPKHEGESKNEPTEGGYDSSPHPRDDGTARAPEVSKPEFPVPSFELEVELLPPGLMSDAEEARVRLEGGRWVIERGDFRAECDPVRRRGWVRQSANPYSIDAVLRMLHSLILARDGGFLVHAASTVRNGRAFLFAGVSGAGKTTISRLAPPDVVLLTDEISYVRKDRSQESGVRSQNAEGRKQKAEGRRQNEDRKDGALESTTSGTCLTPDTRHLTPAYVAFGTPFAGELARIGENLRAPIAALYLLGQGPENTIQDVSQAEAVRALLQNILFFAHDDELVQLVFQTTLEFVSCVPVRRLTFAPDARVWELIR